MPTKHAHLPKYNIGAHFLTAKTFQNMPYFGDSRCAFVFCEELEAVPFSGGFQLLAFGVMPDHVHLLLWWNSEAQPDLTISKIAWAVKGLSARRIVDYLKGQNRVGKGNALVYPPHAPAYPVKTPSHPVLYPAREPEDNPHRRNWRYRIWQPGARYDFNIYTEKKLQEKLVYIHTNPARAGLVETPEAYPWSSAANYAGMPAYHPVTIMPYAEVLL